MALVRVLKTLLAFTLLALCPMGTVAAHEIKPIVIDASLVNDTSLRWVMRLNLEASLAGINAEHDDTDDDPNTENYARLRALKASELLNEFAQKSDSWLEHIEVLDNAGALLASSVVTAVVARADDDSVPRDTLITIDTEFSAASTSWTWQWKNGYAATIVRYNDENNPEQNVAHFVNAGELSPEINVRKPQRVSSVSRTFLNFIKLGFVHILPKGLDHIVFVLGVVLLLPRLKPVALQVTLFTVAHSITLGLAAFGTVSLPVIWVEACIALSVAYIGFDNLKLQPVGLVRMAVVFGFGLLHGLGFANVLGELNTNNSNPLISLAGFNVGVELGQLVVVALFFVAIGLWTRNQSWYGTRIRIPFSLVLSAIGMWWFAERIGLF